jgi:hypothetical protein
LWIHKQQLDPGHQKCNQAHSRDQDLHEVRYNVAADAMLQVSIPLEFGGVSVLVQELGKEKEKKRKKKEKKKKKVKKQKKAN